jgi:hypothetical protein
MCAVEMASVKCYIYVYIRVYIYTHTSCFMMMCRCVEVTLRLYPRNLRAYKVGITDRRHLCIWRWDTFLWYDIITKFHEEFCKHSSKILGFWISYFKAYVIDITDGKDLWSPPLEFAQLQNIHVKFDEGWYGWWLCFRHLAVCVIDGWDRCLNGAWYSYQVSWKLVEAFK